MAEAAHPSPARPAVVLGLTFLLVALTFALPFALVPPGEVALLSDRVSPEVANVYACVAWAGWAHFLFAFRGQGHALARIGRPRLLAYAACVAATVLVLLGLRSTLGPALFGAITWAYFIDHFLKAERSFEGKDQTFWARWATSTQPLLAFTWLSVVLLNLGGIDSQPWLLWTVSLALGAMILALGGWRRLNAGDARSPLLALFFVAEALVWGTYSRYAGPMFLIGVYIFHIAAGSYFHYLGSYFVAHARTGLHPLAILAVNAAVLALGFATAHSPALAWLTPVLGVPWFTLWVATHLVTSDLFPWVKRGAPGRI